MITVRWVDCNKSLVTLKQTGLFAKFIIAVHEIIWFIFCISARSADGYNLDGITKYYLYSVSEICISSPASVCYAIHPDLSIVFVIR